MLKIAIPIPPEDRYPNYFAALEALGAAGVKVSAESDPAEYDGLLLPGGISIRRWTACSGKFWTTL